MRATRQGLDDYKWQALEAAGQHEQVNAVEQVGDLFGRHFAGEVAFNPLLGHEAPCLIELHSVAYCPECQFLAILVFKHFIDFWQQRHILDGFETSDKSDNLFAILHAVLLAQLRPKLIIITAELGAGPIEQDFGGESVGQLGMCFVQ